MAIHYNDSEKMEYPLPEIWFNRILNKAQKGNVINEFNYVYDEDGKVSNVSSVGDISYTSSKEYDSFNRLSQKTIGNKVYRYEYDDTGQLNSVSTGSVNSENKTVEKYVYYTDCFIIFQMVAS